MVSQKPAKFVTPREANHFDLNLFLALTEAIYRRGTPLLDANLLLLGIDGGGTSCRARLCAYSGQVLGEATTGPANLRLGLQQSFAEILDAAAQCLSQAGLQRSYLGKIVACLALA